MKTIHLGQGLEKIKFGMSQAGLKKILGEPDEIENYPSDTLDDLPTETWHFDELEISASFIKVDGWKLESLAISDPDCTLKGQKLIGLPLDKAIEELEKLNLGEVEHEDLSSDDETDYQLLSIYDKGVHFWFDNEILNEISWGPFFDEEDNPIWPA